MTRCAAAATLMDHATACRCCHTTAATLPLPHYFAKPLRAACTLMTPHCCCLAAATLLSSPPTLQSTETRLEYNQARNLQLSVTATTAPVASITTPVDLAANAIASTAFASPTSIPPTRPHDISSTSPPFPTGEEWDHPPLRGRPRRPTPPRSKENETSQPTPRRESGVGGVGSY